MELGTSSRITSSRLAAEESVERKIYQRVDWSAREADLRARWAAGVRAPDIAKEFGCHVTAIEKRAAKLRLGRRPELRPNAWLKDHDAMLARMWAEKAYVEDIATATGHTRESVWNRVHKLKLPHRGYISAESKRWPKEKELKFIKDWNSGRSAGLLAAEYGITRSSLIGKAHRLRRRGVEMRRKEVHTLYTTGKSPRRGAGSRVLRAARVIRPAPVPVEFLGIPFMDLIPNQCRYPRGEDSQMLFCGQPKTVNSSYCAWCHSICYDSGPRVSRPFVFGARYEPRAA